MRTHPHPRFMADRMLLRLGRYLRILGYDAAWSTGLRTHELIRIANAENRIFLTCNRRLDSRYPEPDAAIVLAPATAQEQLKELASLLNLDSQSLVFTRCVSCNVPLEPVAVKQDVAARVHPNVFKRHDKFYRCPSCNGVFWRGSHVRNTTRKLGLPAQDMSV